MLLNLADVSCGYATAPVLKNASVCINDGDLVGIVGPNSSGKSTLLRTMSRILKPWKGEVLLAEKDIYKSSGADLARRMAVVNQEQIMDFSFRVKDLVMMGRIPHIKRFTREGTVDELAVARAMKLTDTAKLADRSVQELSGGEKQRVVLARALAQDPRILLLDEPTTYLDLNYQLEIMELLVRMRSECNLTIIMVLHDINLASRYCDYLMVVKDGEIFAVGSPQEVVTSQMIREVYGCEIRVECSEPAGRPYIVF